MADETISEEAAADEAAGEVDWDVTEDAEEMLLVEDISVEPPVEEPLPLELPTTMFTVQPVLKKRESKITDNNLCMEVPPKRDTIVISGVCKSVKQVVCESEWRMEKKRPSTG